MQTYSNWEWLVTDDCSMDNTYELLSEFAKHDSRVKVIKNDVNSGAGASRNTSILRASGDFLAFLDSDDYWHPHKLERQIEFMRLGVDFSFTAYNIMDAYGNLTGKSVDSGRFQSFDYDQMLRKDATIGCSTVMLRRSAFDNITMPLLRTGQDYALWLSLLKGGVCAHLLGESLTYYRISPNSISRNKFKKAARQWQIYREIEKLSVIKSAYCFVFYAWRATFRR